MPGPDFFQTMMGRNFFEGTMPSIARNLATIAEALKRSNELLEQKPSTAEGQPRDAIPLNKLQRIAVSGYEDGTYSALRSVREFEGIGDTLILAIVRELEDADSTTCALNRLQGMAAQISQVVGAIESSAGQPPATAEWAPEKGVMTDAQFIARRGCHCPSCGSSDLSCQGHIEGEEATASQSVKCENCSATWVDTYSLSGYAELDGGIDLKSVQSIVDEVRSRAQTYRFAIGSEVQAREAVNKTCDQVDPSLSEAERTIAVKLLRAAD